MTTCGLQLIRKGSGTMATRSLQLMRNEACTMTTCGLQLIRKGSGTMTTCRLQLMRNEACTVP